MKNTQATGRRAQPCKLQGKSDPPIDHARTHIAAFKRLFSPPSAPPPAVAAAAGVRPPHSFFFVGDTQAHLMNVTSPSKPPVPEWNFSHPYSFAPAVSRLMAAVLSVVLEAFDSKHVFWCAGNHDGPEDATFCSEEPHVQEASLAWGQSLVSARVVNNQLNRTYESLNTTSNTTNTMNQIDFFLQTG